MVCSKLTTLLSVLAVFASALETGGHAQTESKRWQNPAFYDSFSMGESTWDYDGAQTQRLDGSPYKSIADGWNPLLSNPYEKSQISSAWFDESPDGAPNQAWQTHTPGQQAGPSAARLGTWSQDDGGVWTQSYVPPQKDRQLKSALPASWFDASVNQIDDYGRVKAPFPGNPQILTSLGYQAQTVNTTLSCSKPGCNATVSLMAYSAAQQGQNCLLSVLVEPSAFGVNGSLQFIVVNGATVSLNCQPPASSTATCSAPTDLSNVYPCAYNIDVQNLMQTGGQLNITAQVSASVTDTKCGYKGNLLYAIPQVTCMVINSTALATLELNATRPSAAPVILSKEKRLRGRQMLMQVPRQTFLQRNRGTAFEGKPFI